MVLKHSQILFFFVNNHSQVQYHKQEKFGYPKKIKLASLKCKLVMNNDHGDTNIYTQLIYI